MQSFFQNVIQFISYKLMRLKLRKFCHARSQRKYSFKFKDLSTEASTGLFDPQYSIEKHPSM